MKVLIVDPGGFSPPYDLSLVRSLREQGADVRFLAPEQLMLMWQDPDALPAKLANFSERIVGSLAKRASYVRVLQATFSSVRNWEPDIVHFQWLPFPLIEYQLLKSISRGPKMVFTMHNVGSAHEPRGGIRSLRRREAYKLFDRVIVHSRYSMNEALLQGLVSREKLSVIQHGALTHYRDLAAGVEKAGGERVRILFIGSIKPYKGLDYLIKAFATVEQLYSSSNWELCIAGKPSYDLSSLKRDIEAVGLRDRVNWLTRHLSEREYAELLHLSDVVVLPYTGIDQSGVLMAAIGMGKPVVATRVGAFPELLTSGEHGLLVEPENATALALALHQLVESPCQRNEIAKNLAVLASTTLSWSNLAKQTIDVYEDVLRRQHSYAYA
ncbi:MAG: hypothetical protein C0516_13220 [Gemmatimonas sp.]|nr:hypothetical protein [Gemmatimonas sp.]